MTKVILPAVHSLDRSINGQKIQQLSELESVQEGALASYSSGRLRGKLLVPSDVGPEILIVDKRYSEFGAHDYVVKSELINKGSVLDLSSGQWLAHPSLGEGALHQIPTVLDSWKDAFNFRLENPEQAGGIGLRAPQLGAIHSTLAHWSQSNDLATIVMPTGTGKTDTMLSIMVAARCEKLLIIVPTDALRSQLSDKFVTLGILKHASSDLLSDDVKLPSVCTLRRIPKSVTDVDEICKYSQVIIATSAVTSRCAQSIQDRLMNHCTHLFIDEAHHAQAPSWKSLRESFSSKFVLQFTATPYRQDGKLLEGKIIYRYSLRQAQRDGYFKPIKFIPVMEFQREEADKSIAIAAVKELRKTLHKGHILMARVDSVKRAEEVFKLYSPHTDLNPVCLHTGKTPSERKLAREQILKLESRIIVCVDMLGEGFDLPELKIAAFHDIRKSLAVTLQLAGRFTRARTDLGDAVFIANTADVVVCEELRKLYSREPDWNALLPELADEVVDKRLSLQEFLESFEESEGAIPMRSIFPACSAVVYKTRCNEWNPSNFKEGLKSVAKREHLYHVVSHSKHTLVVVSGMRVAIDWTDADETFDWVWELLVVVWIPEQKLLFINSSNNSGDYLSLARAVAGGDVDKISGQDVFRVFAGVNRLRLHNVGLTEQLGRNVRYTGRMGGDIEPALTDLQRRKTTKSVLAGGGYENGLDVTIAASKKGKIWSHRRARIDQFIVWCASIGSKLLDDSIDPDEVLKGTLAIRVVHQRPAKIAFGIDWPESIFSEIESTWVFEHADTFIYLNDIDFKIDSYEVDGPILFSIQFDEHTEQFGLFIEGTEDSPSFRIECIGESSISIRKGKSELSQKLGEYFEQDPPKIWFTDGSSIEGNQYLELPLIGPSFNKDRILIWDWQGINIRKESQGTDRNVATVQYRAIENIIDKYSLVMDDDGCGEAADIVAVRIQEIEDSRPNIEIDFYHCKYSSDEKPGARVGDLYEVCGQTQKSIFWVSSPTKKTDLITHLMRRSSQQKAKVGVSRIVKGDIALLEKIREMTHTCNITIKMFIVQPGLSKAKISDEQLQLLSVTDNYLNETFQIELTVIGSG